MARKKAAANGNGADHNQEFGEGHNSETDTEALARAAEGAVGIIEEIDAAQAKIDGIMEAAKDECAVHRDEIAKLKKQARDEFNIPAKVLSTAIMKGRQMRRMAEREAAFEGTDAEQYRLIMNSDHYRTQADLFVGAGASEPEHEQAAA